MELKWLEDFLALAELSTFSRAAEARNVTQPAFGRRIRALEHWLGVTLVDRSGHPPELTPAGRMFRESAAELVREFHCLRRDLHQEAGQAGDTLVVLAPHVLAVSVVPGWLREGMNTRLDTILEMAAAFQGACHQTADHAEAVASLLEKREAVFTGD